MTSCGIRDLFQLAMNSAASSKEEAESLVKTASATDADSRAKALGYYMLADERWEAALPGVLELVAWFVEHRPNDAICICPSFTVVPEVYPEHFERLRALWLEHERSGRLEADGLINASKFFANVDWREAERLLLVLRGSSAKGEKRAAIWLGKLRLSLAKAANDDSSAEQAREAFGYCRALADSGDVHAQRICAEAALISDELEKAEHYATLLLDAPDLPRGPDGLAHHVAHCVLGGVYLRRGNIAAACRSLLDAGNTVLDPVTASYGPRLALAKKLLAVGESEAVIDFLKKRGDTWKTGRGCIEQWIDAIGKGQVPDWDNYKDGPS